MARIYFGGGALRVFPSTYKQIEFADEADLDRSTADPRADDLSSARRTRRAATR